jgi:hypothetical protein
MTKQCLLFPIFGKFSARIPKTYIEFLCGIEGEETFRLGFNVRLNALGLTLPHCAIFSSQHGWGTIDRNHDQDQVKAIKLVQS